MFVYLVKCSREKNTHLLHPAGGTEGPASIMLQTNVSHSGEKKMHVDVCAHLVVGLNLKMNFLIYRKLWY